MNNQPVVVMSYQQYCFQQLIDTYPTFFYWLFIIGAAALAVVLLIAFIKGR